MSASPSTAAPSPGPSGPAHSGPGHVRAALVFLLLLVLVTGGAYPFLVTEIAEEFDAGSANGSLLYYPNGTVAGSALVGQNLSVPYLFWERPSISDYNTTLGYGIAPGPSDPALAALFNETILYMRTTGGLGLNATVPFWLVAPSASSIDPDLVPQAVLVQIPRIAGNSSVSVGTLLALVNAHIVEPPLPDVGVPYVNVLELDLALLPLEGR